jgi:hypothetical protein
MAQNSGYRLFLHPHPELSQIVELRIIEEASHRVCDKLYGIQPLPRRIKPLPLLAAGFLNLSGLRYT